MKSIWLCLILAVIIVVLIVVPHIFITNTAAEVRDILKETDDAIEQTNWHKAAKLCDNATEKWEGYAPCYEMITEHEEIDQIIRSLRQLGQFISAKESPEARALIAELDFLIHHLEETDNLSAENIF